MELQSATQGLAIIGEGGGREEGEGGGGGGGGGGRGGGQRHDVSEMAALRLHPSGKLIIKRILPTVDYGSNCAVAPFSMWTGFAIGVSTDCFHALFNQI